MRVFFRFVAVVMAVAFLNGCSSPPAGDGTGASTKSAGRGPSKSEHERKLQSLEKGMTAEQVRSVLGEPQKIGPMESPSGQAEVWTYRTSYVGRLRQVQTGSTTYSRPNPITGVEETVSEPVYSTEQEFVEETIELLIFDGKLIEWKKRRAADRDYH